MNKGQRHELIKKLILEHEVETQDELQKLLEDNGVYTTQATVSRDIGELRISKLSSKSGKHRYILNSSTISGANAPYKHVMGTSIISIEASENIIVIKTVSGMAMAVGAAIDNLEIEDIMGCIAGDDTLFLAIRKKEKAVAIIESIKLQHV